MASPAGRLAPATSSRAERHTDIIIIIINTHTHTHTQREHQHTEHQHTIIKHTHTDKQLHVQTHTHTRAHMYRRAQREGKMERAGKKGGKGLASGRRQTTTTGNAPCMAAAAAGFAALGNAPVRTKRTWEGVRTLALAHQKGRRAPVPDGGADDGDGNAIVLPSIQSCTRQQ